MKSEFISLRVLRPHDLVMVTGAGPYEDSWHPEPGEAE
jgi:hypothetical protein